MNRYNERERKRQLQLQFEPGGDVVHLVILP